MTEKIGCVQHDCDECKARLAQPTSGDYALGYAEGFNDACKRQPERTGWPAGLLQDDDRKLSKWLASKPDAKHVVDMAQSEQNDRRLQIAMRQWEDWKTYALELQKKLVKYEGGSPMILNTQPEQYTDIVSNGGLGPRNKFDAQPEQEPVLCQYAVDVAMPEYRCAGKCQYTHPQQRPWVGLTDDEVIAASAIATYMDDLDAWTFARTIEDKLKEKNT